MINTEYTLYNVYVKYSKLDKDNACNINDAIYETTQGVDLITGSIGLKNSDSIFTDVGREYILRDAIQDLKKKYDYVIIDTPPTLSLLTLNALTCSDDVIIPMQADIFSMQGLSQLIKQIEAIRQYTNSKIKVAGVLLTKYSERNILTRDLYKQIEKVTNDLHLRLFKSTIREAVLVKEAQAQKTNIIDADAKAKVTKDYISFINEYMKGDK